MAILRLVGARDAYLFDPENFGMLLRENGKFGNVYAGARESDQRHVVIKHLNPKLLRYPYGLIQFRFEADMALDHPNLRKTCEYIEVDGNHFLVQEYIQGMEIKEFMGRNRKFKTVEFTVRCMLKVLDALEYLHGHDIVHADIKPANLLIEAKPGEKTGPENPPVKLIDLGNAKTPLALLMVAVKPFAFIYSPPEQVLHQYALVGPSSDLFALAISGYELITGKNAYGTYHPEKLMHMQVSGDLAPDPLIPDKLFVILQKATARKKFPVPPNRLSADRQWKLVEEGIAMRYPDAASFRTALLEFLEGCKSRKTVFSKLFK